MQFTDTNYAPGIKAHSACELTLPRVISKIATRVA